MRDVPGTCRLPAGRPPGPKLRQPSRAARGRHAPTARFAAKREGPAPPDTAPPVAANVPTSRRTVYQQSLSGAGMAGEHGRRGLLHASRIATAAVTTEMFLDQLAGHRLPELPPHFQRMIKMEAGIDRKSTRLNSSHRCI